MIHQACDLRARELLCIHSNQMKLVVVEVSQIHMNFGIGTSGIGNRNLPAANPKRTEA
jgi:hypothetical protein